MGYVKLTRIFSLAIIISLVATLLPSTVVLAAEAMYVYPDSGEVGDEIEVRVVKVNHRRHRIELSLLGLPSEEDEEEIEEEEGEEPLTAMELAWKDAMERQGTSLHVSTHRRGRRKRKAEIRRQQAAIIARTLNTKED